MGAVIRKNLSLNRSLVLDIARFARGVPLFPIERAFELGTLSRLRNESGVRISWPVLLIKAFAIVAERIPTLRQAYIGWPWPHVQECSHSAAMVTVNRQFGGEDRLCFGRFVEPDKSSLVDLQLQLDDYRNQPVEDIFRRQVRLSRQPSWLRAIVWWIAFNFSGDKRPRRIGTFSLSTVAGLGAVNRNHPTTTTTSLSYGPLDEAGRMLVTIICDHRIIDGVLAARTLNELEQTLCTDIAAELRTLARDHLDRQSAPRLAG